MEINLISLRALKYTQERLSEVQDEAYQLKQGLNNQHKLHNQLVQHHGEALQQHILTIHTTKKELTILDKEKSTLQDKPTQAKNLRHSGTRTSRTRRLKG